MLKIQRKKKNDKEFVIFQDGNYVYTKDETSLKDMNYEEVEKLNTKKEKKHVLNIEKLKSEFKSSTNFSAKYQILLDNLKGTRALKFIVCVPCICLMFYVGIDLYNSFVVSNPLQISQAKQNSNISTKENIETKNAVANTSSNNDITEKKSFSQEPSNNNPKNSSPLTILIENDTSLISDISSETSLVESYINNSANYATLMSREKKVLIVYQSNLQELINNEPTFKKEGLIELYNALKERYENAIALTNAVISDLSNSSGRIVLQNHLNSYIQKEVDLKKAQNEIFIQTLDKLNIVYTKNEITGEITFK